MGLFAIAIGAALGAVSLPFAGVALGISAVGPVAGGIYAGMMSAGVVVPVVQSTLMTVGAASIATSAAVGAAAGSLVDK